VRVNTGGNEYAIYVLWSILFWKEKIGWQSFNSYTFAQECVCLQRTNL